jgi:glucose-6-phosphate-specific signal transduction histidine kinase
MNYWQYLKKNRLWMISAIVILFALIYGAGYFMNVDSITEAKYLAFIVGIPVLVFIIGNYIKFKQR